MQENNDLNVPHGLDWKTWTTRWDRMQERYLVRRGERFEVIAGLLRAMPGEAPVRILDLGSGPGSLSQPVLDAMPRSEVVGVDFDVTLLWLADARMQPYGKRYRSVCADLQDPGWAKQVPASVDAVISATALHWFAPDRLVELYGQIAGILRPGGIFLNADHVGSSDPAIQRAWEENRTGMRAASAVTDSDDWNGFWDAYLRELGPEARALRESVVREDDGWEDGLPLAWHLDRLRECGFSGADCFWRCDCDAIYGGIRSEAT